MKSIIVVLQVSLPEAILSDNTKGEGVKEWGGEMVGAPADLKSGMNGKAAVIGSGDTGAYLAHEAINVN